MLPNFLIIGAGAAGITCAISAAAKGKKVCIIDKANQPGGTLHITAGHLSAANTRLQSAKGIGDSADEHYADIVKISRNSMNPMIARKAVDLAPTTLNWLEDIGYPFHEKAPLIIYGHEPYSKPRTYLGTNDISPMIDAPGKTILNLLLPVWNEYTAAGLIDFRANTKLISIQKNENTISSILVEGVNGLQQLSAHNYILTTGGYAANPDFFSKATKHATRLISTANPDSTGDGIIAAQAIGAIFSGAEKHISTLGGIELEPGSGCVNFWNAWARVSNGTDRKQREIYVNDYGERFMNEYDLNVDERERIVLEQPNRRFWLIFNDHGLKDGSSVIPQWNTDQIIAESKKEKAIWQADSIAELAIKTGLPIAELTATVQQYNSFCKQQLDEKFGRTYLNHPIENGPFYAILVYAYSLISFGGIEVNSNLQVLHQNQQAFTNLYAAGEILGAAATSGHAFCGGMLLTPAISFGKWLGEVL